MSQIETLVGMISQLQKLASPEEFSAALSRFSSPPVAEEKRGPGRPPKPSKRASGPHPKGVIPEGIRAWNAFVKDTVLPEMIAADWKHPESGKAATYKDALSEAKKRKDAGLWTNPVAPVSHASSPATSDDESAPKKKPGRPKMTEEQKAAAKLAREAKKASASTEAPSAVASAAAEPVEKKKPGRPKMTDEQKAAAKVAREAKKAAEAAAKKAAPPPTPVVEEEVENELEPVTIDGENYYRSAEGHLFERTDDDELGDWVGMLRADGTIDTDAPCPE